MFNRRTSTPPPLRVCVVGAGTRFLSGISYYTHRLATALERDHEVSVILMRQLLPTRFYPGRARVRSGERLTQLDYGANVPVFDGVDWYWLPSLLRGLAFFFRQKPDVVVFQWWTGTVLHSYLALALAARLRGSQVVIEFHEVLDTGEARLPLARLYVQGVAAILVRLAHGFVVHSDYDLPRVQEHYRLGQRPVEVIPHGPYDQYQPQQVAKREVSTICNLLFFGVIRPYKGLEDLISAFTLIPESDIDNYRLTIVGERWEGWTLPTELIARSRYKDRITFINRYVPDAEVASVFAKADVVVLPYHRSSASGPLHVAMSHGLPVVVTQVGGLPEAVSGYAGAVLIPPQDPVVLRRAIEQAAKMRGQRFVDPHSWAQSVEEFTGLFETMRGDVPVQSEVMV